MEEKVRFFKQDNKWYADIPNHTLEENEMVLGADTFLDIVSKGDDVHMTLTDTEPEKPLLTLHMIRHDNEGAWYDIYGFLYNSIVAKVYPEYPVQQIWICNVTHDVFGEHPEYLYITEIC